MAPPPVPVISLSDPATVSSVCAAHGLTPSELETLRSHAFAAKRLAYCPYSRFRVGAAVLTRGGDLVLGANVENASYPVCTCAERVALCRAVTEGHLPSGNSPGGGDGGRAGEVPGFGSAVGTADPSNRLGTGFRALAVATDISPPASPCGMCRQCIREFCEPDMPVVMFDKNGDFCILKLDELLPLSFGPEALGASPIAPPS